MFVGQIPGADQAIATAAKSGWVEVFLVVIVFVVVGSFLFVLRRVLDDGRQREERLAARVTALENEIRTELFSQLRASTEAMGRVVSVSISMTSAIERISAAMERFSAILESRPCLAMSGEDMVQRIAVSVKEALDKAKS